MHRGSVCNEVCVVVDATVLCIGETTWGAGFGWQKRQLSHVGSVLVQDVQTKV